MTDAREALREGIDLYFDNVGGATLEVALVGVAPARPRRCLRRDLAVQRNGAAAGAEEHVVRRDQAAADRGVHRDRSLRQVPAFLAEVGPWVRDGKVAYRETVVEGLEHAPEALLGLLTGENIGKMLVKIGPDA